MANRDDQPFRGLEPDHCRRSGLKDTVSHYVPPHSPLTSTEPQAFSNNLTMPPEIGQSQPFNPDVGDPFGIELARLLGNFLASVKSLVSGQRAVLRDVWPKIGGQLSEFEQGEYTAKRLDVFEADQAKLLEELRNYSQHKFLPYLNPAWQVSQTMPMAEFQFRLHVDPLLKWDA